MQNKHVTKKSHNKQGKVLDCNIVQKYRTYLYLSYSSELLNQNMSILTKI